MTTIQRATVVLVAVASLAIGATAPRLWAQARNEAIDPASVAAVTAELRQIRLAIEESTRAQTQTQASAVYLTVQKDRILQIATRLDSLRRDLDASVAVTTKAASDIAEEEKALASNTVPPEVRTQVVQHLEYLKRTSGLAQTQERSIRARESELAQALQTEEARWSDLISRMEQAIKR